LVARRDAEALRALPKLIEFVRERQGKSELLFIENWRADAREDS
jgi:hypothetical protein